MRFRVNLRKTAVVAGLVAELALPVWSTAQSRPLKFEVATVKPSEPGGRGGGIRPAPGGERYVATNVPLRLIIAVAYRIKDDQIAGGPSWMESDRFDMNAKAARPSTVEQLHLMLQDLLADQFKLKFHHQTKELPVYALVPDPANAKNAANLHPHMAETAGDPWIDNADQQLKAKWHATFVPMDYFAWRLSLVLDRPVIDLTRLQGGYDFDLAFTRELPPGMSESSLINGAPVDTSGLTIYEALRQQLGLKLEKQKGPVDILVIDHVEKPSAN